MKLICQDCGKGQLVHSGHYWRYRKPTHCGCGGRLLPDESGLRQLKSRDDSLSDTPTGRAFKGIQKLKTKRDKQEIQALKDAK